jgi:hypothetical protein
MGHPSVVRELEPMRLSSQVDSHADSLAPEVFLSCPVQTFPATCFSPLGGVACLGTATNWL